jgi:DNA-binding beta-propeller fold protein YncE
MRRNRPGREAKMASTNTLSIGTELAAHRIDAIAGVGGMGVVYKATDLALNRVVALKIIAESLAQDPEFRARFKQESELAASLDHPNVLPIYTAGEADGLLYITMRYVEGSDLREKITLEGKLSPTTAVRVISQVGSALDAAHKRGLVHRDVKPANVLLAGEKGREHAYLTDFGLTKEAASQEGLTKTGMIVGTMDYIAPEQLQGSTVDARADVYALACVLYEALTGKVPFPRDTDVARMWAHMNEEPSPPSTITTGVSTDLDEVVRRGMAKDAEERYPSAGDLGRAAVAAAAGRRKTVDHGIVATGAAAPGAPPTAPAAAAPPTWAAPPPPPQTIGTPPPPVTGPPHVPASPPYGTPPPGPRPVAAAEKKNRLPLILGLAGGLAALVVLAIVVVVAGSGGGGGSDAVGEVVGDPIPVGKNPVDVEFGEGSVWTANSGEDTVSRIDPEKGTSRQIKVGGIPSSVVIGEGGLWAYNYRDSVTRLDVATGKLSNSVDVGGEPASMAISEGTLWITITNRDQVVRLDAKTGETKGAPIPVGNEPGAIVPDGNRMLVVNAADRTITTIDAPTGDVLGDPLKVPSTADLGGMDLADGTLWVGTNDNSLTPIDAQSFTIGEPIKVQGASYFNASSAGLWVTYPNSNLLELYEPEPPYDTKGEPVRGVAKSASDLLSEGDTLYVANGRLNTVTRVKF